MVSASHSRTASRRGTRTVTRHPHNYLVVVPAKLAVVSGHVNHLPVAYGQRGSLEVPVVLVRCACGRSIVNVQRYPNAALKYEFAKGAQNVSAPESAPGHFGLRRRFTCPAARCGKRFMKSDVDFVAQLDAAIERGDHSVRL